MIPALGPQATAQTQLKGYFFFLGAFFLAFFLCGPGPLSKCGPGPSSVRACGFFLAFLLVAIVTWSPVR